MPDYWDEGEGDYSEEEGKFGAVGATRFTVDISEILQMVDKMDAAGTDILSYFRKQLTIDAKGLLLGVFESAWSTLGQDTFPDSYREHLTDVIKTLPILPIGGGAESGIEVDLNFLGTTDSLERAFHRHAQLEDGSKLDEPYEGQSLKQEDPDKRHEFFIAMLYGRDYFPDKGGHFSTVGLWEQTQQDYLDIWGDSAPYWLYLQYGQQEFEPSIPPFGVVEEFEAQLQDAGNELWAEILDKITTSIVDRKGNLHDPTSGRFTAKR